ncbi:hypothetical protein HRbin35_00359 [bacterium HR35]|nr:hypothetical protein HRbin35_00359 [bacterium HR35]
MFNKKRYKIIKILQSKGFKVKKCIQFANYYRAGFIKHYDCFILKKGKGFYLAKIGYDEEINIILNEERLKTEFLHNSLIKLKNTRIKVPQNLGIFKTRYGSIFLSRYYQNTDFEQPQFLYNSALLKSILLTLKTIYENNHKNKIFLKIFPFRDWKIYFYKGSKETYSSVKSIINKYRKLLIGNSCFWDHYEYSYLDSKDVFNKTLCLINGNLKDEHVIKNGSKFIITDWKRSCISSQAIDYSILKRRALEYSMNECQKIFEIIDKIIYKTIDTSLAKYFLKLTNLMVLHRIFSEFYLRILKAGNKNAFYINPLQISFIFNRIIDNVLKRQEFNVCHSICFRKTFLDIRKILLEKMKRRIDF